MHYTPSSLRSFQNSTPQFLFQWRSFCELVLLPVRFQERFGALQTRSVARRWWWWWWALGQHSDASSAHTHKHTLGERGEGEIQCGFSFGLNTCYLSSCSELSASTNRNERKLDTMTAHARQLATPPAGVWRQSHSLISLSPSTVWPLTGYQCMTLLKLCDAMYFKIECKN